MASPDQYDWSQLDHMLPAMNLHDESPGFEAGQPHEMSFFNHTPVLQIPASDGEEEPHNMYASATQNQSAYIDLNIDTPHGLTASDPTSALPDSIDGQAKRYGDTRSALEGLMGPPPRKRKAPTLRDSDWEPFKERIVELHITNNLPLKDVKEHIEKEFGFSAEIRQYKSRINKWKLDKNIKPEEMKAIVRKRQRRKLVEVDKSDLAFQVRGREVEPRKIERWMRKEGVPESMTYSPDYAASTPSDVDCRTISELGSPAPNPLYAAYMPCSIL